MAKAKRSRIIVRRCGGSSVYNGHTGWDYAQGALIGVDR